MQFTHLVILEHKSHAIHTFGKLIDIMGPVNEQDLGPLVMYFNFQLVTLSRYLLYSFKVD